MSRASFQPTRSEVVVVLCNAPDAATARRIAARLVESGLAACVNILAPCESVYRWEGKIERGAEVPLLAKTTRARLDAAVAAMREAHPFEAPEVIALPVIGGLPEYLDWVRKETGEL